MKRAYTNETYDYEIHENYNNASVPEYSSSHTVSNVTDQRNSASSAADFPTTAEDNSESAMKLRPKSFDSFNSGETKDSGHATEKYSTPGSTNYSSIQFENVPNQVQDISLTPTEERYFSPLPPTFTTDEPKYSTLNPVEIYEDISDDSQLLEDQNQPKYSINQQTYSILNPPPIYEDFSYNSPFNECKRESTYYPDVPSCSALSPVEINQNLPNDFTELEKNKEAPYSSLKYVPMYADNSRDSSLFERAVKFAFDSDESSCSSLKPVKINTDFPSEFPDFEEDKETPCSTLNPVPIKEYSLHDPLEAHVNSILEEDALKKSLEYLQTGCLHAQEIEIEERENTLFSTQIGSVNDEHCFQNTASNLNTNELDEDSLIEKGTDSKGMYIPDESFYSTLNPVEINEDPPTELPAREEVKVTPYSTLNPVPMNECNLYNPLAPHVNSILEEDALKQSLETGCLHTQDMEIKEKKNTLFPKDVSSDKDRHTFQNAASSSNLNSNQLGEDSLTVEVIDLTRCSPVMDEWDIEGNRHSVLEYYKFINKEWRSTASVLEPMLKDMRVQFQNATHFLNQRNDLSEPEESTDDLQSLLNELIFIFRRLKNTIHSTEKLGKMCSIQKKRIDESYFRSSSQRFYSTTSRKQTLILALLSNLNKIKTSMQKNQESITAYNKCKSKILRFCQN